MKCTNFFGRGPRSLLGSSQRSPDPVVGWGKGYPRKGATPSISHPLLRGDEPPSRYTLPLPLINAFLRRLYKYGFMHSIIDIDYLLASSDRKLFINMQNCEHCLNHLLPPRKNIDVVLRPACHEFLLPTCNYELHKCSFIVRCLFNFIND